MEKSLPASWRNSQAFVAHINGRHHEALMLYALGLCMRFGKDQSFASDLLQDFYLTLMTKSEKVQKQYAARGTSYLYVMIKHGMLDHKRKLKSVNRLEDVFGVQRPQIAAIDYLCFDIVYKDFQEQLAKCLNERDAAVMSLYIEGFSYEEIAAELALKIGTVGTIISRSKKRLREHFER
ncbi:MAG: RNA polymerase sigma factor [Bacteroidota bacterium]